MRMMWGTERLKRFETNKIFSEAGRKSQPTASLLACEMKPRILTLLLAFWLARATYLTFSRLYPILAVLAPLSKTNVAIFRLPASRQHSCGGVYSEDRGGI